MSEVKIRMRVKHGTLATWTTVNPTLAEGELGYFSDEQKFIIGDGTTPAMTLWNNLVRWAPESEAGAGGGVLSALEWDANHTTATGNPYKIGDLVYYLGNVYQCIANNDGILPTSTSYWTNLGGGKRLVPVVVDWNAVSGDNQILNKPTFVAGVTDNGGGGVFVDNTDPLNPQVGFGGVTTDGTTIIGNGLDQPLALNGIPDTYTVLATAMDGYPGYLDSKLLAADGSILVDPYTIASAIYFSVLHAPMVVLEGKNTSAANISVGDPVYMTGTVGATNIMQIAKADASDPAKMPAVGVALQDAAPGLGCSIVVSGILRNMNTDPIDGVTPTTNQTLYVKPGGGLTTTKPTGTNLIQNVGKVGKVSGGNAGSIAVSNIQRTNDIPNIPSANFWLGNASGVPTAVTMSGDATITNTGAVTIANDAVTFAKMQNIQTKKLLGRTTASTGDVEEVELSADGTLGGAGASGSVVSSQAAVKNYVDTVAATKEPTLTKGNLTETTSSVLTISGGTGAVIGSGTTVQVKQASASQAGYLSSTDWSTFNSKGSGTVTSIATSSPITGGTITGSGTIGISNAAADGTTKGAATFTASDFSDNGSGVISLDYTNGQAANGSTKGFLTSADWTTFNNKQDTLVSGTNIKTINGSSILGSGDLDTGYTLHVQALTSSPADAATIYFGNLPKAPVTAAATSKVYIPRAGTIKRVEIYCYSGTAGTAENWSGYIRLNNLTDTLIQTVGAATNERRFTNASLNIAVVVGDYFEIKFINPTWSTNPLTTIFGGYVYIE